MGLPYGGGGDALEGEGEKEWRQVGEVPHRVLGGSLGNSSSHCPPWAGEA